MRREMEIGLLTLALGCEDVVRDEFKNNPKVSCIRKYADKLGPVYEEACKNFPEATRQVVEASIKKYDVKNPPQEGWCIGKLVTDSNGKRFVVLSQFLGVPGPQNHWVRVREFDEKKWSYDGCEWLP